MLTAWLSRALGNRGSIFLMFCDIWIHRILELEGHAVGSTAFVPRPWWGHETMRKSRGKPVAGVSYLIPGLGTTASCSSISSPRRACCRGRGSVWPRATCCLVTDQFGCKWPNLLTLLFQTWKPRERTSYTAHKSIVIYLSDSFGIYLVSWVLHSKRQFINRCKKACSEWCKIMRSLQH